MIQVAVPWVAFPWVVVYTAWNQPCSLQNGAINRDFMGLQNASAWRNDLKDQFHKKITVTCSFKNVLSWSYGKFEISTDSFFLITI